MVFQRQKSLLAALVSACAVASCSYDTRPLQGYLGPEMPQELISVVDAPGEVFTLSAETGAPEAIIDGIPFGEEGVSVMPGRHSVEFRFFYKTTDVRCASWNQTDWRRFGDCIKDRTTGICSSSWYTKARAACAIGALPVECTGVFDTKAGARYQLQLSGEVDAEGNFKPMSMSAVEVGQFNIQRDVIKCYSGAKKTVIQRQ